jgi:sterol desaturase/sphingolipid hydroxylase (fatty acid hydroxylase superfamily)
MTERTPPGRASLASVTINCTAIRSKSRIIKAGYQGHRSAQDCSYTAPRAIIGEFAPHRFAGWFVGTFVFYWWHRLRHAKGWWLAFHQIHHSPSRIEVLTSFYKHPIEILCDAILSAVILYPLMGCSLLGAFWYNFFAGTGEYFYHANVKTPSWLRFLIQTPELHSIHHEFNVHQYNFSDIPLWDRLFGTYRDTTEFVERCGFPKGAESKLIPMLAFKDVYVEDGG